MAYWRQLLHRMFLHIVFGGADGFNLLLKLIVVCN